MDRRVPRDKDSPAGDRCRSPRLAAIPGLLEHAAIKGHGVVVRVQVAGRHSPGLDGRQSGVLAVVSIREEVPQLTRQARRDVLVFAEPLPAKLGKRLLPTGGVRVIEFPARRKRGALRNAIEATRLSNHGF